MHAVALSPDSNSAAMIREYIESLEFKMLAPATLEAYSGDLRRLSERLVARNVHLLEATTDDLVKDILIARDSGAKETSIQRYLTSKKGFYDFLVHRKLIPENPLSSVHGSSVKRQSDHSRILTPQELDALLNRSHSRDAYGKRNGLILKCLAMTDLGVSRILSLTPIHINPITGKGPTLHRGRKVLQIFFDESLVREIQNFVKFYRPALLRGGESEYLFPAKRRGGRMGRQNVWHILKNCASRVGLSEQITTRDIRRSYRLHTKKE
jgi:integrase/recombinase XerD